MFSFRVLIAVLFVSCVVSAQDTPYNCDVNLTSGDHVYHFNLLPLYHEAGKQDSLSYLFYEGLMSFNFCGISSAQCNTTGSSICLRTTKWDYYSSGLLKTQTVTATHSSVEDPDKAFVIQYTNGDSTGCEDGERRSVTVYVHCNPLAKPGFFNGPVEVKGCHYTFDLYSVAGCGVKVK